MSTRNKLYLQKGPESFQITVSETGTDISTSGVFKIAANMIEVQQAGQSQPTDIFSKFSQVETLIATNQGTTDSSFELLGQRITGVNSSLDAAIMDLDSHTMGANLKYTANTQAILDENTQRGHAIDLLDQKYSSVHSDGEMYQLSQEIDSERNKIDQEVMSGGDREVAINAAEEACNNAVDAQKLRINALEAKLNAFFGSITPDSMNNLATLIQAYQQADSNLVQTLGNANSALTSLTATFDATFPPDAQ
jgi:hypothetical protein